MPRAFFLVGPTAAGKTETAHRLAARLRLDVVSADAMLVYRGMDIGTAKPSPGERRRFRYAGVDLVDPDTVFSVGAYRAAIRTAAAAWPAPDRPRLVVGGSGLYVKALLEGIDGDAAGVAERAAAERLRREGGLAALHEALAALADPRNPRRVARALERALRGEGTRPRRREPAGLLVGLRPERDHLRARIAERARRMFEGGLVEEAAGLRARFGALSATAAGAIGYREAFAVLEGRLDRAEAVERTAARTRALARRQMTWFRHQARVACVDAAEGQMPGDVADRVCVHWERHGPLELDLGPEPRA